LRGFGFAPILAGICRRKRDCSGFIGLHDLADSGARGQ
jgi:hypothetical protein